MARTMAQRTNRKSVDAGSVHAKQDEARSALPLWPIDNPDNNRCITDRPTLPPALMALSLPNPECNNEQWKPLKDLESSTMPLPCRGRPQIGMPPRHIRIAERCASAKEISGNHEWRVGKRTGPLTGRRVPTARASALLDVERATPASHTQGVRLGRALTKTARALCHLGGRSGGGVSTPKRGNVTGGSERWWRRARVRRPSSRTRCLRRGNNFPTAADGAIGVCRASKAELLARRTKHRFDRSRWTHCRRHYLRVFSCLSTT